MSEESPPQPVIRHGAHIAYSERKLKRLTLEDDLCLHHSHSDGAPSSATWRACSQPARRSPPLRRVTTPQKLLACACQRPRYARERIGCAAGRRPISWSIIRCAPTYLGHST